VPRQPPAGPPPMTAPPITIRPLSPIFGGAHDARRRPACPTAAGGRCGIVVVAVMIR
jgi:hypothetical protein